MQNEINQHIDSLIAEGNGYLPDNDRKLLFKLAMMENCIKRKDDFDLLVDERLKLYSESENCPNCSAPKSKLLQVCDSCGYTLPGAHTSSISVQSLVESIENSIEAVKSAPKPNIFNLFKAQYHILFPYLTIWTGAIYGIMSINYDVRSMPVFVAFFAVLSIISFIYKKTKDKTEMMSMIKSFASNFDKTKLLAKRHYGNEPSVQKLLATYEEKIAKIKKQKKIIRLYLLIIYALVLLLTGYVAYALPWKSQNERNEEFDKVGKEYYKKKSAQLMVESTKQLQPILEKQMLLSRLDNKIDGFLSNKIQLKTRQIKIRFIQQNFIQYENERAGFQLIADSVLIEIKGKVDTKQRFDLELCAYDVNNYPSIFNTHLTCTDTSEFRKLIVKGKGTCYVGFASSIIPFDDAENREIAKSDIEIYDKSKFFNLVSRAK